MIFGIRGNINKPELPAVAFRLIKELNRKKISYLVEKELAKLISRDFDHKIPAKLRPSNRELINSSDFIVSIGGDGTFLATAKYAGSRNIPIIGVNMGKLGFLAETSTSNIVRFISDIIKGKYLIEEKAVLSACSDAFPDKHIYALNEIVVNQYGVIKIIDIQAFYNDQLISNSHADGIIISTPTGSTGYSLSAGGPIVLPKTRVLILAPLSPHTLTARPVILPDDGVIKIKVNSRVPIIVTADGNANLKLKSPAIVEIKKASYTIKLVKAPDSNYFKTLNKKLLWGEDRRKYN